MFYLFLERLDRWTKYVIMLFIGIMTIDVSANVIARYILRISIIWAEELSIYLMIWFSMLGAAVGFREGAHVCFTILKNKLPIELRYHVTLFNHVIVLGFLGFMVYYGFTISYVNWAQRTPALRLSQGIPYLSIPVSGILMILQIVGLALKDMGELRGHPENIN